MACVAGLVAGIEALYKPTVYTGVAEMQRELGRCLAGLGDCTWQSACTSKRLLPMLPLGPIPPPLAAARAIRRSFTVYERMCEVHAR